MTTAVPSKPAPAPAPKPSPAKTIFQGNVAIEKIGVYHNIRKSMNPKKLQELTDSIRQIGVKQAVLLRPAAEAGKYLIVDGHRRLKAAAAAGLKSVPAIVQDLTADQAAIDQFITYLQREDVGVIEEARGFKMLIDSQKYTVESIAQLVDKSLPYVYRAVHLLELPAKALAALESGVITPAHGHQLLRVPEKGRDEMVKDLLEGGYDGHIMSAAELRQQIEDELGQDLDGARFTKDKPYAGAIACTLCPNNSGNQGVLFDGAEKGTCTLKPCFDKKTKQYWDDVVARLEALGAQVLVSPHSLYENQYISGRNVGKEITRDQIKKGQVIVLSKGNGRIHATIERKGGSSRKSSVPAYDYERDNFISCATVSAVWNADARAALKIKASRKIYEEVALNLLRNTRSDAFAQALSLEKIVVSKLTDDQLAAAMIFGTRNHGWAPDAKKVREEAKKKAAAEYKAKKDAKKA